MAKARALNREAAKHQPSAFERPLDILDENCSPK
jgi:hypothetical protein